MRRVQKLSVLLAVMVLTAASVRHLWPAEMPSMQFRDDFTTLDTGRWTAGKEHTLGRSVMKPGNVDVEDGMLRLKMSPGVLDGAEVKTVAAAPAGVLEARLKLADAPTSVTGLFFYAAPDLAQEIDIELYNQPAGRIRFTSYSGGALTHTSEQALPFDPTADFHLYGIASTPAGVEFYVDHELVEAWDGGVPREPMNVYLNTWYPQWLAGKPVSGVRYTIVDYVAHRR
ncbi:glycoside hydrolase family 16 protein [Actinoplanes sp. NPDC048967]|uniref:glycoside hydrolase family 16 protein n=1 Tax=Actinoplanes sp. NPDC048967 TaxID=3155269 RepID=UPI0033E35590